MRELHSLVPLGFNKLHIGSVLAVLQKLPDTLCGAFPRYNLCCPHIPCSSSFRKVDTVLGIPNGKLAVIGLDAGSTMIFLFEQVCDFFHRLLLLKSGGNHHSRVLGVARQTEHIVNIILGKRKSEGCRFYTLRFINESYLFLFGWNQPHIKEGKLTA